MRSLYPRDKVPEDVVVPILAVLGLAAVPLNTKVCVHVPRPTRARATS